MKSTGKRGRSLDHTRDEAILATAVELVREKGLERFRMQDVAERAHVGLGTIYRRWPTKEFLIVAALKSQMADIDERHTHDLDGLRRQFVEMANMLQVGRDVVPGLIVALNRDPAFTETFRDSWLDPRMNAVRAAVEASAQAAVPERILTLIAEIGPALLMYRAFVMHEPADDMAVDDIIGCLAALLSGEADLGAPGSTPRPIRQRPRTTRSSRNGQGQGTKSATSR